jgi:hypothetical protein
MKYDPRIRPKSVGHPKTEGKKAGVHQLVDLHFYLAISAQHKRQSERACELIAKNIIQSNMWRISVHPFVRA